jgi:hypothetical protein
MGLLLYIHIAETAEFSTAPCKDFSFWCNRRRVIVACIDLNEVTLIPFLCERIRIKLMRNRYLSLNFFIWSWRGLLTIHRQAIVHTKLLLVIATPYEELPFRWALFILTTLRKKVFCTSIDILLHFNKG